MDRNYFFFRRWLKVSHLGHPLPIRAPHGSPQNTNDYILFPDSRVMDSMDYHWKYLSNALKTLHDSNRECSRDSGGDSKEEDYMVLLQTQWECFRRWLKVSHLSHPWWFSHLFSHPFSHLDLLVEEAKSHQFYRFHHCQSQDFYFCKGSKEGKTLRF